MIRKLGAIVLVDEKTGKATVDQPENGGAFGGRLCRGDVLLAVGDEPFDRWLERDPSERPILAITLIRDAKLMTVDPEPPVIEEDQPNSIATPSAFDAIEASLLQFVQQSESLPDAIPAAMDQDSIENGAAEEPLSPEVASPDAAEVEGGDDGAVPIPCDSVGRARTGLEWGAKRAPPNMPAEVVSFYDAVRRERRSSRSYDPFRDDESDPFRVRP